ncbi:hypothetical protein JOB18_039106 [Solea senegalensis]|uniref:Transmembrane protein n=1 Tax=Solea senegalensis TaxID=28829 RepID=A0AAV6Q677_SOLSE|nr:hypothetical protein JOB18_039106 [Solea senegalensis]
MKSNVPQRLQNNPQHDRDDKQRGTKGRSTFTRDLYAFTEGKEREKIRRRKKKPLFTHRIQTTLLHFKPGRSPPSPPEEHWKLIFFSSPPLSSKTSPREGEKERLSLAGVWFFSFLYFFSSFSFFFCSFCGVEN